MKQRWLTALIFTLPLALFACSDTPDTTPPDATPTDTHTPDSHTPDVPPTDTATPDPNTPVPCDTICRTPPATYCDDTKLHSFPTRGECFDDACHYEETVSTCRDGCLDGACITPPPCDSECDDPPATTCIDAHTVRSFANEGQCVNGRCQYENLDTACPHGCQNGACLDDACDALTCDTPPAPTCDDNLRITYNAEGICSDGTCAYASSTIPCPYGCEAGECRPDPTPVCETDCDTPPASHCEDDTLRSYQSQGQCEAGECVYTPVDTPCSAGCEAGACLEDPCAGLLCDTPPAPHCEDGARVTYDAQGICQDTECIYTPTLTPCPDGCEDGNCSVPADFIISEVYYDAPGHDTECFIELYGPPNTPLDGFELIGINGANNDLYVSIPLTGSTTDTGFFVVMQPTAPEDWLDKAQMLDNRADLQNGPDSVQLRYGPIVVDALAYGRFKITEFPAGLGDPSVKADPGESLARDAQMTNTRNNADDFSPGLPTPGEPSP